MGGAEESIRFEFKLTDELVAENKGRVYVNGSYELFVFTL